MGLLRTAKNSSLQSGHVSACVGGRRGVWLSGALHRPASGLQAEKVLWVADALDDVMHHTAVQAVPGGGGGGAFIHAGLFCSGELLGPLNH